MPIGVLPALEQRRELAKAQGDRPERLLAVGDGVVAGVGEQELVELQATPLVADEDARVSERAQVDDPETVAPELAKPRAAWRSSSRRAVSSSPSSAAASASRHRGIHGKRSPWSWISGQSSGRRPCAQRIASICA